MSDVLKERQLGYSSLNSDVHGFWYNLQDGDSMLELNPHKIRSIIAENPPFFFCTEGSVVLVLS